MPNSKLKPNDPRVQHKHTTLNGRSYHYLLSAPTTTPQTGTIFLVHGWPDFSFGWRYQIPFLTSLGLRVVAPDMQGYGQSGSPQPLSDFTLKAASDDLAALAKELDCPRIFILGHDWGGAVVWRFALWHPELVISVSSICTPYWAPSKQYFPLELAVKTVVPNFKYQLQLGGPEVEKEIVGKERLKAFLRGMYGGLTSDGKPVFSVSQGVDFEALKDVQPGGFLDAEELDHYVEEYNRNGMRGPLNWYRTRQLNFEEEKVLAEKEDLKVQPPSLFVLSKRDAALPKAMSEGMEEHFVDLTRVEIDASHWVLCEKPDEVNGIVKDFLQKYMSGAAGSRL